jgi:predicted ABC-type ATPase
MIRNQAGHILKTLMVHGNMSKPIILAFAKPNGSGKSTITAMIPHYGVYINADDLKKEYGFTDIEATILSLRNSIMLFYALLSYFIYIFIIETFFFQVLYHVILRLIKLHPALSC